MHAHRSKSDMSSLKDFISTVAAMAVVLVCGTAQAETVSYAFEAKITNTYNTGSSVKLETGETVLGSFSFDTDDALLESGIVSIYASGDIDSSVSTDGVDSSGGLTVVTEGSNGFFGPRNDSLTISDTDGKTYQIVSLEIKGSKGALDLNSLTLDDIVSGTYYVQVYTAGGYSFSFGTTESASGKITSLARLGGSVPELSASGTATSVGLLLGAALMINTRRRGEVEHS